MGRRFSGEFFLVRHLSFGFCLAFHLLTVQSRFEAFDEPWKKSFDTDTQKWESKWGLMDENRNVKDGLKIPDCGGLTVDKPY